MILVIEGSVGFPNACAYVAAKHGMLGLTKTAAIDHGAQDIRVKCRRSRIYQNSTFGKS